jgi:HEAT repeat protein
VIGLAIELWLCASLATMLGCGAQAPEPTYGGKSLSKWMEPLKSEDDPHAFAEAVEAVVAMGEPAVPKLLEWLDDPDTHLRRGSALALLRINREVGLPAVTARLNGADAAVAISMAHAMIRANVQPELCVPVLAHNIKDPEYQIHNQSIKALGELGPQSGSAVGALAELLRHDADAEVRWRAAYALLRIGSSAAGAVPALREALADPDAKVREGAAYALGAVGPAAKEARDALRVALSDSDPHVRFRASKALEKL